MKSSMTIGERCGGFLEVDITVSKKERERFRNGKLSEEWANKYHNIFDDDDRRLAAGPQGRSGRHFYEWKAATLLWDNMRCLSLVEKYNCYNHERKQDIFKKKLPLPPKVMSLFEHHKRNHLGQGPDLLVYKPDHSNWFFCETKGKDTLKPAQKQFFQEIADASEKPILLIKFKLSEEVEEGAETEGDWTGLKKMMKG